MSRICVLDARSSRKHFCSHLDDNFDCTAPTHQYDYCRMFSARLNHNIKVL